MALAGPQARVQLILTNGTPYGQPGHLDFRAASVDPSTGTIALRGVIPNAHGHLLPGMFVHVQLTAGKALHAFLVPQTAVQRDGNGDAYVLTVNADDTVAKRPVQTEGTLGSDWIVWHGLRAGEHVIVSGIQDAQPGKKVAPRPEDGVTQASRSEPRVPQFFIRHPIFAWVIAILICLGGAIALSRLPIDSYPEVAPPQVIITAHYPGANAKTVESTVTQVIEQQLTGIDNLLYFTSQSSYGQSQITLTFATGTDPDIAEVQTQNRVALAEPQLPAEVNQQGININKSSAGFLAVMALRSRPGGPDRAELNHWVAAHIIDQIARLPGVGSANLFGSDYAMRIWLNPNELHAYHMSASAALQAIQGQNIQIAAGSIGAAPAVPGQQTTATVTAQGWFNTPQQFRDILLRTNPDGTSVYLKDVAEVHDGNRVQTALVRINGKPGLACHMHLDKAAENARGGKAPPAVAGPQQGCGRKAGGRAGRGEKPPHRCD